MLGIHSSTTLTGVMLSIVAECMGAMVLVQIALLETNRGESQGQERVMRHTSHPCRGLLLLQQAIKNRTEELPSADRIMRYPHR
jgi:hypothetical protein